jgi:hypothetical protein
MTGRGRRQENYDVEGDEKEYEEEKKKNIIPLFLKREGTAELLLF